MKTFDQPKLSKAGDTAPICITAHFPLAVSIQYVTHAFICFDLNVCKGYSKSKHLKMQTHMIAD